MRLFILLLLLPTLLFSQDTLYLRKRNYQTGNVIGIKYNNLYIVTQYNGVLTYNLKQIDSIAISTQNANKQTIDAVFNYAKPFADSLEFTCDIHRGQDIFTKEKYVATIKGPAFGNVAFNYYIDNNDTLLLVHKTNTVDNPNSGFSFLSLLQSGETLLSNFPSVGPGDSLVIATPDKNYIFWSAGNYSTLQNPMYSTTTYTLDAAYRLPYKALIELKDIRPVAARMSTSLGNLDFSIEERASKQLRSNAICLVLELMQLGKNLIVINK